MAVKMGLFCAALVLCIVGSRAAGELTILHSPDSLKFFGSNSLLESSLKEVISASLGLSVEESSSWNGLSVSDPFNTPEAVVEVYVDGISNLGPIVKSAHSYPLIVDEYEPDTFDALKHRINQRFSGAANKIVNIRLSNEKEVNEYSDVFGPIKVPKISKRTLQHLKYNVEEDNQFLHELEVLAAIADKVKQGAVSADNVVDFYNFRFTSLHALSDYHGPNSLQTKEAKKLLGETLQTLSEAFSKAYDGSVVVTAVATDVAHTRRAPRSVATREEIGKINLAGSYDEDYPAVFNIILWFCVVFIFALTAIIYSLMDMDPGRDSIIYRMTNTRMKKDN